MFDEKTLKALHKAMKLGIGSAELGRVTVADFASYVDARAHASEAKVAQYIEELATSEIGGTSIADMALEAYTLLRKEGQSPTEAVERIIETVVDAATARAEAGYGYTVNLFE
ncbi:hypothetical protein AB0L00_24215 [Actinoallomurus sp. NPDC052308]|uniref:hypothetical protein n=1 Tax=Actinoallomurus sp. NPDC052308 TaxID=3155530 RepID=UPI00341500DF